MQPQGVKKECIFRERGENLLVMESGQLKGRWEGGLWRHMGRVCATWAACSMTVWAGGEQGAGSAVHVANHKSRLQLSSVSCVSLNW